MAYDWDNWRSVAESDLAAANVLLDERIFRLAAFHSHQAAEAILKALWIEHGDGLPPRTHDLVAIASGAGADESVLTAARRLNVHYSASRYPDATLGDPESNYDESLATELVAAAELIVEWSLAKLRR